MPRNYQRQHLRAPYRVWVLFEDEGFVHKCRTLNLSEGGMLLDQVPHLPSADSVPIMAPIPQFPHFKNYSFEKLSSFSNEIFPKKIIRMKARMVRREGMTTSVDDVFKTRFGIQFVEISPTVQTCVSDYVDVFLSNIVHLLRLIEDASSSEESLAGARVLGSILGYSDKLRLAEFRLQALHDYKSLQW